MASAHLPLVLLVESDKILGCRIRCWFDKLDASAALAPNVEKAISQIRDAAGAGWYIDALVLGPNVDLCACRRIVSEFQLENPWATVTWLTDAETPSAREWAALTGVSLLSVPKKREDLKACLAPAEVAV